MYRRRDASEIAAALEGRRSGDEWVGRCPAHDDDHPSLSITEKGGKVLVHCFAGCAQHSVIAALRDRGLWESDRNSDVDWPRQWPSPPAIGDPRKSEQAARIWAETASPAGTLVEAYLRRRGITLPVPESLRFHPGLFYDPTTVLPAMVGLISAPDGGAPAIHRTFLDASTEGKAAVRTPRKMLGRCPGGALRLAEAGPELMIGEGIETCLSAMEAMNLPAWSALTAGRLKDVVLPSVTRKVFILVDADVPGERAAVAAALRWEALGLEVRLARPPKGFDFNDMLLGKHRQLK